LLADPNTWKAAGEQLAGILEENGIEYSKHVYLKTGFKPDEHAVGNALMHFDARCDLIIGVGSGVINDVGKVLSNTTGRKYFIVATAPSMDGYASCTSSMECDGVKVSLGSRCPDVIFGDTDILRQAPLHMLKSGIGDMLAKYISVAEWRMARIIAGEYYCEEVAQLMRGALKRCVDNAEGLMKRDAEAVQAVFDGLIIAGLAMAYADVTRPASGVEHYFSHVWDMRGLELGTPVDLHGIQVGIGTLLSLKVYDLLKAATPDREKALSYVKSFSFEAWSEDLRKLLGTAAETMIEAEAGAGKYNLEKHAARLEKIIDNWDEIKKIMAEELPDAKTVEDLMDLIGAPKAVEEIGICPDCLKDSFKATKDIRDKYVASRLAWDLGLIEEFCEKLF
ncbi:MAG: sn-glycerol-1-phosphate dehydrogenase, partial [Clostridia bacterium]|nr:sn-glycerol-1-phosphate dehydrogenase [Clostridia bacterium]